MNNHFDLQKALATWRHTLEHNHIFTTDDLDELEQHLRDQIASQIANGAPEKAAFRHALHEMGAYTSAEAEYRKVYLGKLKKRRHFVSDLLWRTAMLKNYLTIAWRHVLRNKTYAGINLFGLSVSLAACLILGLYVAQSLSYDQFHSDADRIVRIAQQNATGENYSRMPPGLTNVINTEFPEVEAATDLRGFANQERIFTHDDTYTKINGIITADERFFDVFSFELISGDGARALSAPHQLIITASTAEQLFGEENPIGKILHLDGTKPYTIAAIAEDPPHHTHLPFRIILSLSQKEREKSQNDVLWTHFQGRIYAKLKPGINRDAFAEKLNDYQKQHRPSVQGRPGEYFVQSLTDIYLHSKLEEEYSPTSDIRYLYIFGVAGLIILLIACMNYVNLSLAQSTQRGREVGVRKVMGATKKQLLGQFLSESTLLILMAIPPAIGLALLALPFMNELTGQSLSLTIANHPAVWGGTLALLLAVSLGAGGYPAFILSAYRPTRVFKGSSTMSSGRGILRAGLLVFQFATSFILVASALVIYNQLNFLQTKRLGFDTEQIVTFNAPDWKWDRFDAFKASLTNVSSIVNVAAGPPLGIGWFSGRMTKNFSPGSEEWQTLNILTVGYDYFETMGFNLISGRSFSRDFLTDPEAAVIVTSSTLSMMGFEGNGLGETMDAFGDKTIVGVVEDFHNSSLKETLLPTAITLNPSQTPSLLARLAPGQTDEGLVALEDAWEALVPDRPFTFQFLDEKIQAQYLSEQRLSRVFGLFAGLAVALAALGLFGVAAFTAKQRTKEIGIRKVLGASTFGIVRLLTREFVVLVGIAVILAGPVSYIGANRWLEEFAYRIDLGPGILLTTGVLAMGIALITVSSQAIRAAHANPTDSIRCE